MKWLRANVNSSTQLTIIGTAPIVARAEQGLETLALRMARVCENTQRVAEYLEAHERINWVSYAGLASHRDHHLAQR